MEQAENLKGHLIAAHPKRKEGHFRKGVILIIDQDYTGCIGLQINKPMTNHPNLSGVMSSLGINYQSDTNIYFGGPENTNRIIVVHSADWISPGTTKLNDEICISNDISVLAAIAANQGPSKFRAIAGYTRWMPGHLEGEIEGDPPFHDVSASWSYVPSNSEFVFTNEGTDQWHLVLEQSAKALIDTWF